MYKAADLPLNQRGAVYHIDLLPNELADTIITVGDPARVKQVSQYFDRIEFTRSHREFVTHTGYLNNNRLTVLSTGIGMSNIDIVMNELDALANIDLKTRTPLDIKKTLTIIRLGTTGSLKESSQLGDLLVSRYAIGFDTLLHYYHCELSADLIKLQTDLTAHLKDSSGPFYVAKSDSELFKHFINLGTASITATCGGFYGPQGRELRIPLTYPDLLGKLIAFTFNEYHVYNFEMETAGILGLGSLFGHQCLSISTVIANRITGEFCSNINPLVESLIAKTLEYI